MAFITLLFSPFVKSIEVTTWSLAIMFACLIAWLGCGTPFTWKYARIPLIGVAVSEKYSKLFAPRKRLSSPAGTSPFTYEPIKLALVPVTVRCEVLA